MVFSTPIAHVPEWWCCTDFMFIWQLSGTLNLMAIPPTRRSHRGNSHDTRRCRGQNKHRFWFELLPVQGGLGRATTAVHAARHACDSGIKRIAIRPAGSTTLFTRWLEGTHMPEFRKFNVVLAFWGSTVCNRHLQWGQSCNGAS